MTYFALSIVTYVLIFGSLALIFVGQWKGWRRRFFALPIGLASVALVTAILALMALGRDQ